MNALSLAIDPNTEKKLSGATGALVEEANGCVAFDDTSLAACIDLCGRIKQHINHAEKERTALVKPFNDGVKAINARFKTMTDPLSLAERHVKGEIAGYQAKRQEELDRAARAELNRLRDEARAAAEAERDAGNFIQAEMMAKDIKTITVDALRVGHGKETGASSSITKVWKFEIVDELAAASTRPDLMQVDPVKVRAAIKAGVRDVPGLRIYEEAVVAIR